jgi:AraC-like DNA-binding protein
VSGLFSARVLLGPLAFARGRGLEAQLLAAAQLDARAGQNLDEWLPNDLARRVMEFLEQETGDPLVGLRCADASPPEAFDYVHFIGASSPDLGVALRHFESLFPQLATDARATVHATSKGVRLALHVADEELGPRAVEYVVASAWRGFQRISTTPLGPVRVEWRHALSKGAAEHPTYFGCKVHASQQENALVFAPAVLAFQTTQPNPALQNAMLRYAEVVGQRQPRAERVSEQLEQWLLQRLGKGSVTIAAAAKWLGTSQRTLQRKLDAEDAQFRALVDRVRERLARSYLQAPEIGIGEVAGLLGYADARAFHRAFVGWTGMTPGRFRASAADG